MPSGRTASGGSSTAATQVSRRWGFRTQAGAGHRSLRSLPRSPRRTGGSGVAPAGRATAGSPPGTWHGAAESAAAASRRGCASIAAAGRGVPGKRSSRDSMPAACRTGSPEHCHAMAAAAMTVAAGHRGTRSHPAGRGPPTRSPRSSHPSGCRQVGRPSRSGATRPRPVRRR
jgi:hypothetical protein